MLSFVDNHVLNINILIELFFKVLYCPLRQMQVALPAYGTAATKAALPVVFGIVNVRRHVDACDCTRGLYGHRKSLH